MRILAFDVGTVRTGVAVSDESGVLATPVAVIKKSAPEKIAEEAARLVTEYGAARAVVGLPTRTDGGEGTTAPLARAFAAELEKRCCAEIVFRDEKFSTVIATQHFNEAGKKGARKRRETIDAAAAAVILQEYLDFVKRSESTCAE